MKDFSQQIFHSPLDSSHQVKVPWMWMPTLFFTKGLAYVALFFVSLVVFKRLGLSNAEVTLFTSWFLLPCIMRPLFSIFVHTGHRNRMWILVTELLTALSVAGIGYALTAGAWLEGVVFFFWVMAFANVFHDIATDKFSMRAIGYQHVSALRIFKVACYLLALLVGLGVIVMIAGNMEVVTRTIKGSWSTAFYTLSGILFALLAWHVVAIPTSGSDNRERKIRVTDMFYACLNTCADLIRTPRSWPGILFLSLFLLPAALLTPVSLLFMLDLGSSGGIGLAPQEFGYVQGTVGVFGLMLGGVAGAWALRRYGQKTMLPFMALCMAMPGMIYIHLSFALPESISWIAACTFVQQVAHGFGFCAYLQYVIYYSEVKRFSTYALCMSFVAVAIMIPTMLAGTLQETLGYRRFFIFTALCGIAPLIVSAIVLGLHGKEKY